MYNLDMDLNILKRFKVTIDISWSTVWASIFYLELELDIVYFA